MQASHDDKHAKCFDSKVGMRFDPHMVLQDDSGVVQYNLAVIIFRTGGMGNGHFYVAAPTSAGAWMMHNNNNIQGPMPLKQLQQKEGMHAHGMMYVRTKAPATDDWDDLIPTGRMYKSVQRLRYATGGFYTKAPRQRFAEWLSK